MTIKTYEVGGCVRDSILRVPTNDIDLLLVGASSFEAGVDHAKVLGLNPIPGTFKPEFVTFKASVPSGHKLREQCKAVDFVLARKDGFHGDGRRPDSTEPGTLEDDLARRDFTVNAMARDLETGEIIDPFGGRVDLRAGLLRFVGKPLERIKEDGLRVLRGYRFQVTKDLVPDTDTGYGLRSRTAIEMLSRVSRERVREELEKMFKHSTVETLEVLGLLPGAMRMAIFSDGLRLSATLKQ